MVVLLVAPSNKRRPPGTASRKPNSPNRIPSLRKSPDICLRLIPCDRKSPISRFLSVTFMIIVAVIPRVAIRRAKYRTKRIIVNILLIVSLTRERSCPRVSEFSAKSYFGYDAEISRATVEAAALDWGFRLIKKRGALYWPRKNLFWELNETTMVSLAKLLPN